VKITKFVLYEINFGRFLGEAGLFQRIFQCPEIFFGDEMTTIIFKDQIRDNHIDTWRRLK